MNSQMTNSKGKGQIARASQGRIPKTHRETAKTTLPMFFGQLQPGDKLGKANALCRYGKAIDDRVKLLEANHEHLVQ